MYLLIEALAIIKAVVVFLGISEAMDFIGIQAKEPDVIVRFDFPTFMLCHAV